MWGLCSAYSKKQMKRVLQKWLGATMIVAMMFGMGIQTASADHDPYGGAVIDKVTVCHATGSSSNPYNSQEVAVSSSGAPQGGHDGHDDDIIPPYHWDGGTYPGKNWTPENEILWHDGGCDGVAATPTPGPGTPTPTPSGTPIPTPTPDATIMVIKHVINDNGGTEDADDFTMHIWDAAMFDVTGSPFDGDESGTTVDVSAGDYTVGEDANPDYMMTITGDCAADGSITVLAGEDYTCTVTNDDIPGEIHGSKFEDTNGDGTWDVGEPGLMGWVINLYDNADPMVFMASTSTDASGSYEFDDLDVGTYNVRETQMPGWTQTTDDPDPIAIGLADMVMDVDFGNFENVSITGYKLDVNGASLSMWTIFIDEMPYNDMWDVGETSMVTTSSLGYTFEDLGPGTYHVCEVIQSGWQPASGTFCQDVVVDMSGENHLGVNFVNIQDQEGTIGFWKNWTKHKWLTWSMVNAWIDEIDAESKWLMTESGYTSSPEGMVALINIATKQCNKSGSTACAMKKFQAQYLVTLLDEKSDRKDMDTWYAVSSDAQTLLGLSAMEQLDDIIAATEAWTDSGLRSDYLTLAGLFDSINNTGY